MQNQCSISLRSQTNQKPKTIKENQKLWDKKIFYNPSANANNDQLIDQLIKNNMKAQYKGSYYQENFDRSITNRVNIGWFWWLVSIPSLILKNVRSQLKQNYLLQLW